jgi:polysaccharide chain length determinant protein (PEP-CTERM system associated)
MAQSKIGESGLEIVLNILRRRKWLGIAVFLAALSLAAPFSAFLPDIYRGTATVMVESQGDSGLARTSTPLETRLVTIQQEILSRSRLSNLITTLNLYPQWRGQMPQDAIIERLRRDIHMDFAGTDMTHGYVTTTSVKLTYIGLDPRSAAAVPNVLATQYVQENNRLRERQAGQMAQFLKGQLDAAAQQLQVQEQKLNAFKSVHAGELPDQVSINMMTVQQLSSQLSINAENQSKVRERLDRAGGGAPASADPLTLARNHLHELEAKYTDRHPEVIAARSEVARLEAQPHDPPSNPPADSGTRAELAALQREEQMLRSQMAAYNQRINSAPQHEQELQKLENDYKTMKDTYDSLHNRYEEAQLADSLAVNRKGESFRVLDAAVPPTAPAAPNRSRLRLIALFFALAMGVGAMLLAEHLDTSFHTVGELRSFTTIPVLATIPYIETRANFASQALRAVMITGAVIAVCALLAFVAWHTARGNTQLVWILAGPQA